MSTSPRVVSREPKQVFSIQSKDRWCILPIALFPPPKLDVAANPYTAIRAELLVHGSDPPDPALPSTHPVSRS